MLTDADIQRIVGRVVEGCRPIAAGTFGSYAVGLAREGSDLDLFVIQRTTLPKSARRRAIYRHLFGIMHPLDVHVFTPEEFEADAQEELSFAWIIARQARLYYRTEDAARQIPALRVAGHVRPASNLERDAYAPGPAWSASRSSTVLIRELTPK